MEGLSSPGPLTMLDLVDMVPSGSPVTSEAADRTVVAELFNHGVSQGSTAFLYVPEGSSLVYCVHGGTSLRRLVLGGRAIVESGRTVPGSPLAILATERALNGSYGAPAPDFDAVPGDVALTEILRDYLAQALDGVIGPNDITEGRITRCVQ